MGEVMKFSCWRAWGPQGNSPAHSINNEISWLIGCCSIGCWKNEMKIFDLNEVNEAKAAGRPKRSATKPATPTKSTINFMNWLIDCCLAWLGWLRHTAGQPNQTLQWNWMALNSISWSLIGDCALYFHSINKTISFHSHSMKMFYWLHSTLIKK